MVMQLNKLPGIGPKTAQRLTLFLLQEQQQRVQELVGAILEARQSVSYCRICGVLTDLNPCKICSSDRRDNQIICIVESPKDAIALEKTGIYRGLYHVLNGVISPMDGIGPDNLNIAKLFQRIQKGEVKEIILATNPSVEGEATSAYLLKELTGYNLKITRLAYGLPVGTDLEYVDELTLIRSLEGRNLIK